MDAPLVENDAVVLGILLALLAAIFVAEKSAHPVARRFFKVVPGLLLCYFLPSLLVAANVVSAERSQLYTVASRVLLPTCLVYLTLSVDLPAVVRLGRHALTMFLTGTVGIMIGAPVALLVFRALFPELASSEGPDALWRGMTTVAGSWIGGGANQTAMKEVYEVGDRVFSTMIAVDVLCANVWMAVLLALAGQRARVDRWLGADTRALDALVARVEDEAAHATRAPTTTELMVLLAVGFGCTAVAHAVADVVAPLVATHAPGLARFSLTSGFFWIVVVATTLGVALSFTPAAALERVGASKVGSAMLYLLVATIGMKMDVFALKDAPALFVLGLVWLAVHAALLLVVAKLTHAPLFFLAVGSQANVGGAASAPVVASAFSPALASVGVLLAVLGYALGTYGAWLVGQVLRALA